MARARREVAGWEKKSDTPQREYKSVSFVLESADENTGEFSGYAAVFGNVDSGGDVIEKGARLHVLDFSLIVHGPGDDGHLPQLDLLPPAPSPRMTSWPR